MMNFSKHVALLSLAGCMVFSSALMAQTSANQAANSANQVTSPPQSANNLQAAKDAREAGNTPMSAGGDAHFVMAASAAGDTEIMASRMATTHAQSPKIKAFAETMLKDHTAANDKLRTIAQKNGYTLAGAAMVQQQPELTQLDSLHGADFDKAYTTMMQKDHQDAVQLFTSESSTGTNQAVKAFAAQTLPTLQHHLQMAQAL